MYIWYLYLFDIYFIFIIELSFRYIKDNKIWLIVKEFIILEDIFKYINKRNGEFYSMLLW